MNDIRQKLKEIAQNKGIAEINIIGIYVREGIIDRIWKSQHNNNFILKGASVFQVLQGSPHRPTADIDLLGFGSNQEEDLKALFTGICAIDLNDGLNFTSISTSILQKGSKYQGVRLIVSGNLESIPIKAQLDIGYGHKVTPKAIDAKFPTLLDRTPPEIRTYPVETIVAEKLEAIVSIGIRNSRLKDYYDLLYLSRNFYFKGLILQSAIINTFEHRKTAIPKDAPVGLTKEFTTYRKARNKEWKNLFQEGTMKSRVDLNTAIALISQFVTPLLCSTRTQSKFNRDWNKGQWQGENRFEKNSKPLFPEQDYSKILREDRQTRRENR